MNKKSELNKLNLLVIVFIIAVLTYSMTSIFVANKSISITGNAVLENGLTAITGMATCTPGDASKCENNQQLYCQRTNSYSCNCRTRYGAFGRVIGTSCSTCYNYEWISTGYCCPTPTTCAAQGKNCGEINDGCTRTLNCGTCSSNSSCVNNVCKFCAAKTTCAAQGKNCGPIDDGCGGTLACGVCAEGQACTNNVCIAKPNCFSSSLRIEAEDYTSAVEIGIGQGDAEKFASGGKLVGWINNGDSTTYGCVDFPNGATSVSVSAGNGNTEDESMEIWVVDDGVAPVKAGTCTVKLSGGYWTYYTNTCPVAIYPGQHKIQLKFTGGTGYLYNFDWFQFSGAQAACVPKTSCSPDKTCGTEDDGCGGKINCGTCSSDQVCVNDVCTLPSCTSFSYSDWSTCQPDGTQTRTIIGTPQGCIPVLANPPAFVSNTIIKNDAWISYASTGKVLTSGTVTTTQQTDSALIVKVSINSVNTQPNAGIDPIVSITFNNIPLKKLIDVGPIRQQIAPVQRAEIWYLANPPVGTYALNVTQGIGTQNAGTRMTIVDVEQWSNVNQNMPLGAAVSAIGKATSPTVTVSSGQGEVVTDVLATRLGATGVSPSTAQTQIYQEILGTSGWGERGAGSYKTGEASTVMSWSLQGLTDSEWIIIGAPVKGSPIAAPELSRVCEYAPPFSICGNNKVETGENCDGTDFDGKTCQSQGFHSGTLLCDHNCYFNTTSCVPPVEHCTESDATEGTNDVAGYILMDSLQQPDGTPLKLYDACDSYNFLSEMVCNSDTNISMNIVTKKCDNGCEDGRCLGPQTGVKVLGASYGACSALSATKSSCDGQENCNYLIDTTKYPAGCTGYEYSVTYSCPADSVPGVISHPRTIKLGGVQWALAMPYAANKVTAVLRCTCRSPYGIIEAESFSTADSSYSTRTGRIYTQPTRLSAGGYMPRGYSSATNPPYSGENGANSEYGLFMSVDAVGTYGVYGSNQQNYDCFDFKTGATSLELNFTNGNIYAGNVTIFADDAKVGHCFLKPNPSNYGTPWKIASCPVTISPGIHAITLVFTNAAQPRLDWLKFNDQPYAGCGNGVIDGAEQCDGTNLNGNSCTSLGYAQGTLSCNYDCTFNPTKCTGTENVALASKGATTLASTEGAWGTYSSKTIDGDLRDSSAWGGLAVPQNVTVTFAGSKTIKEIDVISARNEINQGYSNDLTTLCSSYCLTEFSVQYWSGTNWINVGSVSIPPSSDGKRYSHVWNRFTFSPVTTNKIRISITRTGSADGISRIAEIQAWT